MAVKAGILHSKCRAQASFHCFFMVIVVVSFELFLTCSEQWQVVLNSGVSLADWHRNEDWLELIRVLLCAC